ncbi:hypothetical protein PUN28_007039 [Cardiocondyla obscurior]|uniref:Uncharacterized protein n=1 Tax=Cardiocondyla obscurior TaxID=286306 RepID=A0AAW2G615_9HYME
MYVYDVHCCKLLPCRGLDEICNCVFLSGVFRNKNDSERIMALHCYRDLHLGIGLELAALYSVLGLPSYANH